MKEVSSVSGSFGPVSFTASFDIGNSGWPSSVQAKVGSLGVVGVFDPSKPPLSSLSGIGVGYVSSIQGPGSNGSWFAGAVLDERALKIV